MKDQTCRKQIAHETHQTQTLLLLLKIRRNYSDSSDGTRGETLRGISHRWKSQTADKKHPALADEERRAVNPERWASK